MQQEKALEREKVSLEELFSEIKVDTESEEKVERKINLNNVSSQKQYSEIVMEQIEDIEFRKFFEKLSIFFDEMNKKCKNKKEKFSWKMTDNDFGQYFVFNLMVLIVLGIVSISVSSWILFIISGVVVFFANIVTLVCKAETAESNYVNGFLEESFKDLEIENEKLEKMIPILLIVFAIKRKVTDKKIQKNLTKFLLEEHNDFKNNATDKNELIKNIYDYYIEFFEHSKIRDIINSENNKFLGKILEV